MDNPLTTIKPNTKKVLLFNLSKIVIVLSVVVGTILYFNYIGTLTVFAEVLESFGITINTSMLLFWFILAIVIVALVILVFSYLSLRKAQYMFYDNKFVAGDKDIPYKNIVKINYDNEGIGNSILGTGTMNIELTGMKEDKIRLEFIDDVEKVTNYFQNLLKNFRARLYTQTNEQQRMGNILDKM